MRLRPRRRGGAARSDACPRRSGDRRAHRPRRRRRSPGRGRSSRRQRGHRRQHGDDRGRVPGRPGGLRRRRRGRRGRGRRVGERAAPERDADRVVAPGGGPPGPGARRCRARGRSGGGPRVGGLGRPGRGGCLFRTTAGTARGHPIGRRRGQDRRGPGLARGRRRSPVDLAPLVAVGVRVLLGARVVGAAQREPAEARAHRDRRSTSSTVNEARPTSADERSSIPTESTNSASRIHAQQARGGARHERGLEPGPFRWHAVGDHLGAAPHEADSRRTPSSTARPQQAQLRRTRTRGRRRASAPRRRAAS